MKTIRLENTNYNNLQGTDFVDKIIVGDDINGNINAISVPKTKISVNLIDLTNFVKEYVNNLVDFQTERYRIIRNLPIEGGYSAPFKVYLDVSNKCQLACKFCLSSSSSNGKDELPFLEIKKIIEEMGNLGVFKLKLGGGEPLIHPYIFEIIELLKKNHIFVSLSTNGQSVNIEKAELLKYFGVKTSVSLDGNEDCNDYLRGKGSYKKAVESLKLLKNEGIEDLSVRMNLIPLNFGSVSHVVELAKILGIKAKFCFCRPSGRANKDENMLIKFSDFREYYEVLKYLNSPEILPFVSIDEAMMFFQPDELKTYIWGEQICGAGNRSIHIDGVGRVSPCVYMGKDYQQGRILKDGGLLDFWKGNVGSAFTKIRNLQEPEECKSCDKLCKYECPAIRSYLSNGDTTGKNPTCLKEITKKL